jgi:beta-lactamase class A
MNLRSNSPLARSALLLAVVTLATLPAGIGAQAIQTPRESVAALIREASSDGVEVGLYYRSTDGRDSLLVSPDLRMHAASTMKVPVMLQLFLDQDAGLLELDAPIPVRTDFRSILDGSVYELDAASDSEQNLYGQVGDSLPRRDLIERMITRSSNLATNLLIADADAERVTATMRRLGADSIEVLRGVEDIPAFEAGLSNTTTARDMGIVMRALVEGGIASETSRREMLAILERQQFRGKIPAGVPADTRVANKTGGITGIHHDAAIVFPEGDAPYVLVVLIRGYPGESDLADSLAAALSRAIWAMHASASG